MGLSTAKSKKSFQQWAIGIAVLLIIALPLVYSAIVVPLPPSQQAQVSLALIAFALLARLSRVMRPLIIFLSCFASMRYFYWRISSTINFDSGMDAAVSLFLLAAEMYGLMVLFLGYFQTIEFLKRLPQPLKNTPTVDVFIPTYNESEQIVRRTVIGAMAIDYPFKKVYVLDDGHRPAIKSMADNLGCAYIARPDNHHAKAGNLNHALSLTDGELIAIFDADHVPVRGFLNKTVGFFKDQKVALVQTAQHFFNPDPYERNLNLTGRVAPEQTFFYHVIQPGNDFWNAAFFCGSCAVLRRSILKEIGGFKTKTVTEDAHTALEMHSRGYLSVYLPLPLAAGLATETFAAHVKQRIRWARGMAQILRIDCPLFKRGLSFPQRLNYFNAMLHFFFGIPRLIMILAPLTYLLLGAHPIKADALAVIAYILPHIGLSIIANSIISKNFRHSFWAGVYEVSIAPFTAGVTLLALLNPGLGKFNVTDKGTNLDKARFDFRTCWTTLGLLGLSVIALMIAFPLRLILFIYQGANHSELDSILINSVWVLANLVTLIAAACVSYEQPQQRQTPRVKHNFPCELLVDNHRIACRTQDISEGGIQVLLDRPAAVPAECQILISSDHGVRVRVKGRRVRCDWNEVGQVAAAFAFVGLDAPVHQQLVQLIFSGDQSWTRQSYAKDRPLHSFWYLLTTFWRVTKPPKVLSRHSPRLSGHWRAWLEETECECLAVSGTGALIQFPRIVPELGNQANFRLQMQPGRIVTVNSENLSLLLRDSNQFVLKFVWPEFSEFKAFCECLYQQSSVSRAKPQKSYFWSWIEDLR
jgi:cellulose synthase (UDP-forming)